jgi:hypothetical protein
LLCLDKSLVVILNYVLTAEQPDPCGPEPYSPGKRPRARSPLGEGPVTPRAPEEVALSQNSWRPRTSQGVPDTRQVPDPHILSGPLSRVEPTPRLGLVRSRHVSTGASTRAGLRGFHWKTRLPTAFNAVGGSALCHSRARGGFCQVALLAACYQGAQCSRWRRPRRVCQTTMPVGHDGSSSLIMTPTR